LCFFKHANFLRGVVNKGGQMACRGLQNSDKEIAALFLVDIEFLLPEVRGLVVENLVKKWPSPRMSRRRGRTARVADLAPNAEFHFFEGIGHCSIFGHAHDILNPRIKEIIERYF
jgi:hypothetical protein